MAVQNYEIIDGIPYKLAYENTIELDTVHAADYQLLSTFGTDGSCKIDLSQDRDARAYFDPTRFANDDDRPNPLVPKSIIRINGVTIGKTFTKYVGPTSFDFWSGECELNSEETVEDVYSYDVNLYFGLINDLHDSEEYHYGPYAYLTAMMINADDLESYEKLLEMIGYESDAALKLEIMLPVINEFTSFDVSFGDVTDDDPFYRTIPATVIGHPVIDYDKLLFNYDPEGELGVANKLVNVNAIIDGLFCEGAPQLWTDLENLISAAWTAESYSVILDPASGEEVEQSLFPEYSIFSSNSGLYFEVSSETNEITTAEWDDGAENTAALERFANKTINIKLLGYVAAPTPEPLEPVPGIHFMTINEGVRKILENIDDGAIPYSSDLRESLNQIIEANYIGEAPYCSNIADALYMVLTMAENNDIPSKENYNGGVMFTSINTAIRTWYKETFDEELPYSSDIGITLTQILKARSNSVQSLDAYKSSSIADKLYALLESYFV